MKQITKNALQATIGTIVVIAALLLLFWISDASAQVNVPYTFKGATQLVEQTREVPIFDEQGRKMLFAHKHSWNDKLERWEFRHHDDYSVFGKYLSDDLRIAERQMEMAQWAGIDGFFYSWWGQGSYEDYRFAEALVIAERLGFKVGISLETLASQNPATARSPEVLREWLEYAIEEYGDSPAMMQVDGEPLFCLWASSATPMEDWERILGSLPAKFLGMHADVEELSLFDGQYQYMAHNIDKPEKTMRFRNQSVMFYSYQTGVPKIYTASVAPGYSRNDDQENKVERNDGRTYEMYWDAAIASGARWIFITSWDEYPEATYIEPSMEYGIKYLELTKEYAEKWRAE